MRSADNGRPGVAVRMLTSGTTGPPKRIDLTYQTLERVLVGAKHYESNRDADLRLRKGVAVVNSPLVHLGGLFRVLQCVSDGRSFSLLERFTVEGWVDAVRRHRPATASLVPTALRMVLEADVDPADLASLRSVVSGTAPLDPDDADAFIARYGVPVLVSYAATEFGGGVAGWNIDDHRGFWATKRGSVGRAHAGLRAAGGRPRLRRAARRRRGGGPRGEGRPARRRRGWVRTTDLARIDDDGFLLILGRADQAIIRGGFKVRPDDVRAALERHPAVRGAAVVSRDDRRLGAVPVAAVELRAGADAVGPDDLLAHAADRAGPLRAAGRDPRRRRAAPHRLGQGRPGRGERAARRREPGSLSVDLRYSDADEAFRKEVRAWLDEAVPAYGPPPRPATGRPGGPTTPAGSAGSTTPATPGCSWPVEYGGPGPAGVPAARVPRGVRGLGRAVRRHQLRRQRPRRPDAHRRGHRGAAPATTCPASCGARACGARGSPSRRPAPTSPRCAPGRCGDGDDYVVTGQKIWSTRAHVADYCELLVRTDPDAPKHKGITWLILDMHQPGVEVRPMKTIDGESHFCEVFLDEARVPVDQPGGRRERRLAGHQRDPALRAGHRLRPAHHHPALAAPAARGPGRARPPAAARPPTTRAAGATLGRLDARVEALWRMTQRCVTEAEASGVPSPLGSAVKLGYSELGQEIAQLGMRLLGRRAIGADGPDSEEARVVRDYLWSFQYTIAAGTSQIQRNLIAERILGMPKGR